jgi:5-methylcytosine-specific restriction endonuclease McrA
VIPCASPGCAEPAIIRGRCRTHATEARRDNRSSFDAFYSSKAWKVTRNWFLFNHPLCGYELPDGTRCGKVADSVHHVVELSDGGARRDPANLQSLCRRHHSQLHAQRRGRVG